MERCPKFKTGALSLQAVIYYHPFTELLRRANTFHKQQGQNLYGSTSSMCLTRPIPGPHYALSGPWSSILQRSSNIWLCGEQALAPALIRRLPINNSDIRALNGRRWLLVVSRIGSVSYYDLEAQKPVKRLLIPAVRSEISDE